MSDEKVNILPDDTAGLDNYENKYVALKGKISKLPWQHLIATFEDYPEIYYLDIGKEFNEYQVVIYCNKNIPELKTGTILIVKGKVVKLEGRSKRPVDKIVIYHEYHIKVDEIKILNE